MSDTENLTRAIQTLSIVLEEISNQLAQIRFEMQTKNHSNSNQSIYNHECNDCGKCVIEGIETPEGL